jgi:hypothetical protein
MISLLIALNRPANAWRIPGGIYLNVLAVTGGVVDPGVEEYTVGADLELVVVDRCLLAGGNEHFHHFLVVDRIVSLAESAPDILVVTAEVNVECLAIVAEPDSRLLDGGSTAVGEDQWRQRW